ncbi:MAG: GIY-YIG nuclease family protein [Gammaproteobacteria bacterium]|nr:GIY-YIG nuclease family protein [Gammaproteobacteria bacterium]
MRQWHLYVLRTRYGALYTGITTDVARRLNQHGAGTGAKALRSRGPLALVYQVPIGSRGSALRAELAVKKLPKARKEALVIAQPDGPTLCARLHVPAEYRPKGVSGR